MDVVVGSGPAGIACVAALLKQGRDVCLLDVGLTLDAEREAFTHRMAQLPPEAWKPEEIRRLKQGMTPSASGIPDKLLFGSDFPYRDTEAQLNLAPDGVGLRASLALGGLSNVWGSALLPYRQDDIADWPITLRELEPHYHAALSLTGMATTPDALAEMFPLYADQITRLESSRQAKVMWAALQKNRAKLNATGIHFGHSRLAVRGTSANPNTPGCVHCGLCMFGCVYGHIYSAQHSFPRFSQTGRFRYQGNHVVETVSETAAGVSISGRYHDSQKSFRVVADRVYLAAGIIPTTGIILRSLGAFDETVHIKDSQYFLLPVALTRRIPGVRSERLHALSQIFLELLDPKISTHTVHIQTYSYNDLMGQVVRKTCGPLDFLARELEGRLLLLQGFIHSNDSGSIATTLRRSPMTPQGILEMKACPSAHAKKVVHRVVRKLLRHTTKLGAIPLPPMLQLGKPGRSFHAGSSFPMSDRPGKFAADIWGRPAGWQRIHAVDATVLPSIPATTITLTAMANAHRIGAAANQLEQFSSEK